MILYIVLYNNIYHQNNNLTTVKRYIQLSALLFLIFVHVSGQTPAFPGAEGHGRFTSGGRGGTVYFVSNLTDVNSGNLATREGSLRWCLGQPGPKTILFNVSGTIVLNSPLNISVSKVTIAGQSAPGDGICIAGYPVTIGANDVIIRFIRMRMGDAKPMNSDGADALGLRRVKNVIIDHCSMSWSTDECVSIYENENTTLQWSIISESLRLSGHSKGPHGYGGIWGGKNASFHHNLMAHNDSRTPRFGPGVDTQLNEYTDMRNCVIYNWSGNGCYGAEAMNINIVNNFYKPGPATPSGSKRGRIIAVDKKTNLSTSDSFYPVNNKWGTFYIDGNVIDASTSTSSSDKTVCTNATNDNWNYGVYNQIGSGYNITSAEKIALKSQNPVAESNVVTTHTAQTAYEKVLLYAGASLVRDSYDQRIVSETTTGTAAFKGLSPYNGLGSVTYPAGTVIGNTTLTTTTTIDWKSTSYPKWGIIDSQNDIRPADAPADWSAWPTLAQGELKTDANRDGIPDEWLASNFPGKKSTDLNEEGYTYLEVYLNSIVSNIIAEQNKDAITSSVESPIFQQFNISAFINSASNKLMVNADKMIDRVEVYGLSGNLLLIKKIDTLSSEFDVSFFDKGVYLVKFVLDDFSQSGVKKIIKI